MTQKVKTSGEKCGFDVSAGGSWERRRGALMVCLVRGIDWGGDQGYIGTLKEL